MQFKLYYLLGYTLTRLARHPFVGQIRRLRPSNIVLNNITSLIQPFCSSPPGSLVTYF